jgi:predicted 3-demethylubiquinone-9 3-methyltransferase (glyoxalase superfamily)
MFTGRAKEALDFYVATLPDSEILSLEPGDNGTVKRAVARLAGQRVMAIDSPPVHAFTFTPSVSFFVECAGEAEIDRLYAAFLDGGGALMPLGSYGFSKKFGWLDDRFGVSWQFNLNQ